MISPNRTEAQALENCLLNRTNNPGIALKCTWEDVVLVDRAAAAECSTTVNVCRKGIFSDDQDGPTTSSWACTTLAGGPTISCSRG